MGELIVAAGLFTGQCHSCHLTNSIKALKVADKRLTNYSCSSEMSCQYA